ncbi:hypothetical protein ACLOJK_009285 [Asimina triloba]
MQIYVPTNPRGAELLPPGIVVPESDFYLRRLWGNPSEDLTNRPKYLVTFTVGLNQRNNIDAAVRKIMLFHYDGRTSEWDQFEWSKRAVHRIKHSVKGHLYIHVCYFSALCMDAVIVDQSPRYSSLHAHIDFQQYVFSFWMRTSTVIGFSVLPVLRNTTEKPGWCSDPFLPPCAADHERLSRSSKIREKCALDSALSIRPHAAVRIHQLAPIVCFGRTMAKNSPADRSFPNDLVHGWGLDFALRRCVEPAHEKIGVVDSQWIIHQVIPSLGNQEGIADLLCGNSCCLPLTAIVALRIHGCTSSAALVKILPGGVVELAMY